MNHFINNLGPHKLPLIGRADWNDCLILNCFSCVLFDSFQTTENKPKASKAERLMSAGLFAVTDKDNEALGKQRACGVAACALVLGGREAVVRSPGEAVQVQTVVRVGSADERQRVWSQVVDHMVQ